MKQEEYVLSLRFSSSGKEQYYNGVSRYNSRIVDHLDIADSHIIIRFNRVKKAHPEEYVYSESSPVRYQLYRAACFYLAVTGSLPKVTRISLKGNGNSKILDKTVLIHGWNHCKINITLPRETAAKCFTEEDRKYYTIITFFLKAQLDQFSHDAFRAAWSGLNAYYNQLSNSQRESDKLLMLKKLIQKNGLPGTEQFVLTLTEDFWKHIQWHNYVQWRSLETVEDAVRGNRYRDRIIYGKLSGYLLGVYKKQKPGEAGELEQFIQNRMKKKVDDSNERVCFLVTDYCYMLRNRSFHAGKPYPIFGKQPTEEITVEENLTAVIIHTIRDLLN